MPYIEKPVYVISVSAELPKLDKRPPSTRKVPFFTRKSEDGREADKVLGNL